MSGINLSRLLLGGLAAGILIWLLEGAASILYLEDMQAALEARGLSMDMTVQAFAISVLVSLLAGLTLVFFYAASRPRFGPGPGTAVLVAVVLWLGAYVTSLLGYELLGLFPGRMLVLWGSVGLVEMVLAALLGGWIYREA